MNKHCIEKKFTVLIVDDDEVVRMLLKAMLEEDFHILAAAGGIKGLDLVKNNEVHVIILDLNLPDINGLDVLREVKSKYDKIKIIMISALKEHSTVSKAMEIGAFDYITKCLDPYGLRETVWRAIPALDRLLRN